MSQPAKPTPPEAFDMLVYDAENGVLRWRVSTKSKGREGEIAGLPNDLGFWIIKIKGKRYKRSRLTWALCKGADAPLDIEVNHKDLDAANDRIDNLQLNTRLPRTPAAHRP